jgi:hypothetical protein
MLLLHPSRSSPLLFFVLLSCQNAPP